VVVPDNIDRGGVLVEPGRSATFMFFFQYTDVCDNLLGIVGASPRDGAMAVARQS
jgi:hypothetical protein